MKGDDTDYIGLPLAEARELAKSRDLRSRVLKIDGNPQIITMDLHYYRVNFEVEKGIVVATNRDCSESGIRLEGLRG